ncbi:hypothetical protein C8A05DRAFT_41430 [Staphylotrichum tortipilum]|uniref:N-acetyltransferase domain-containing protein n=1 Tax=Staphylotrichum tortipilum TaxID=2831512 RepID=A0AAN6RWS5_9PEZI|nr:hypothetical protein C8A05DRAFT_41430 [Staphylotrichum longicolle]
MKPRLGVPADVDAITHVIINAMPLDPQWPYRFPYRHRYPVDHYKYTRMLIEYFLDPAYDDWLVMVVEDSPEPGGPTAVVSFGIWDVSYLNRRRYGPGYTPQDPVTEVQQRGGKTRRDANPQHFAAFRTGQIKACKQLFGAVRAEQLHLQILATHTQFQRRGHASSLCQWAMDLARRDDALKAMSVMASPMGHPLYARLGFEWVGALCIQEPGEAERLVLQAMVYRPGKDAQRLDTIAHGEIYSLVS